MQNKNNKKKKNINTGKNIKNKKYLIPVKWYNDEIPIKRG